MVLPFEHVSDLEPDEQQAQLLRVLRRSGGKPVSYQQLRDAGIEYPASVVSELELAGLPLERAYEGSLSARRLLGVRLDPRYEAAEGGLSAGPDEEDQPTLLLGEPRHSIAAIDLAAAAAALARRALPILLGLVARARAASRAAGHAARPRGGEARGRWLAPAALITAAALVAALAVGRGTGTREHSSQPVHRSRPGTPATPSVSSPTARHQQRVPASPSTPVSPVLAAQLEARGHALLEGGQFAGAISVLKRAVAATGEKLESCLEPSSETCLTYAYALYDLGRALRLDRHPGTAVPILEQRLQIDNQRPAVQTELELARREAGRQGPPAPSAA